MVNITINNVTHTFNKGWDDIQRIFPNARLNWEN
jgi:hypothetical protein